MIFSTRVADPKARKCGCSLVKFTSPHPDPAKHAYASVWRDRIPLPSGETKTRLGGLR